VSPDVRAFYAELGVHLPARGSGNVDVRCFLNPNAHKRADKSASCSISLDHGAFQCHGCGAKGGPYDAALGVLRSSREAMELLEQFGLVDGGGPRPKPKPAARVTGLFDDPAPTHEPRLAATEQDVARWHRALLEDAQQLARLDELRGWTRKAVEEEPDLGFDGARITFVGRHADGSLAGVGRYEPDPERREKRGERKFRAVPGSKRELFPAPERVLMADEPLFLVEGEPDAVRICSIGLPAVGVPGAQGWRSEWAPRFAGRRVVVCFDCDQQGRAVRDRVVADLQAAGVDAWPLELDENRHDGFDISDCDFVRAAKTAQEAAEARGLLLDWAEKVRPPSSVEPTPEPEAGPDMSTAKRISFERLTARETLALPEPPESAELVGPLLVRGQRTIVVGDSGHGKTSFALQLVAAAVEGRDFLQWTGGGGVRALIVDLEQGLRSVKRSLRESGLEHSEALDVIRVPDGLALDRDEAELVELDRHIAEGGPAVVVIDPYYKAHQADGNEERAIVDLFRVLDALRAKHDFALVLPAHPRKDIVGSSGARKLTLHDVAGSGAVVRGAEIVLALERLSHGYARLRVLKDRDGDLPVGEAWPLVFARGEGFKLDPKEERTGEELEARILSDTSRAWRTVKEWAAALGIREERAKKTLETLAETGRLEVAVGPPGRSPLAQCYRTAPVAWEQSGAVVHSPPDSDTAPLLPTSIGDVGAGSSRTSPLESGAVATSLLLGDEGYDEQLLAAVDAGHITQAEACQDFDAHKLVLQMRGSRASA
jgi:hypothetical protein